MFLTVKVNFTGSTGWDEVTYTNRETEDLDQKISGRRTGFASINIFNREADPFRDNPMDIGEFIQTCLQDPNIAVELTSDGVGLQNIGSPSDISVVSNTDEYEARAVMTIDFNVNVSKISRVLEIQSVAVTGDVEVDGDSFPVNLLISQ